jgi:hypothetical protein
LLEIMMTVAITATVFAMVGGILISVLTTVENVENQVKTEKAGYGILATMRRDLTGVYAYALGGLAFRGTNNTEAGKGADQLDFVTTADVMETEDGTTPRLIEVGYKLGTAEGPGNPLVLYRRATAFADDPLQSDDDYIELFGAVNSLELTYLDPESEEWEEEWEDPERLPKAVKITLELLLDEAQLIAMEQGGQDIPAPKYELIIGISSSAGPKAEDPQAGGQAPPPAGGAGS